MRLRQYIRELQALEEKHGDLEVQKTSVYGDRVNAMSPSIAHVQVLRGRETKQRFASTYEEDDGRVGEKVVRI